MPEPPSSRRLLRKLAPLILAAVCCSCGEEQPYRKETFPVTGRVVVDGKPPGSPVKVTCHSVTGIDQEHPTFSWCLTETDGSFEISTYEAGDGVPAGDYALTFFWGRHNVIAMSYGGPDKLKGRYDELKDSPVKFTVKPGEPTDLGTIELTTK